MFPLVISFHLIVLYLNPLIVAAPAAPKDGSTARSNGAPLIPTLAPPRSSSSASHSSISQLNTAVNHPIQCFHPLPLAYRAAEPEDCNAIIDIIILRYPEPFAGLSWGYTDGQDINLSLEQNSKWILGECMIFVRSPNQSSVDTFRIVDVAARAKDIIKDCVVGTKEGYGGFSDVGHLPYVQSFYVAVGGRDDKLANPMVLSPPTNDTNISASSNKTVLSLSRNTERSIDEQIMLGTSETKERPR